MVPGLTELVLQRMGGVLETRGLPAHRRVIRGHPFPVGLETVKWGERDMAAEALQLHMTDSSIGEVEESNGDDSSSDDE